MVRRTTTIRCAHRGANRHPGFPGLHRDLYGHTPELRDGRTRPPFNSVKGHMLIHEFVAAHRREILQACNNAVRGEPSAEQMDRYANAVFEQVLRFLEARTAHDLHEPAREGNSATPRFELEIVVGASTQMRRTRAAI